ncbi:hypothetical protein C8R47DRAFT_1136909 [Mycena vitilis]|nr:hypothetical protein C8R47DRAFT_1136909 [Mycena vitilis]
MPVLVGHGLLAALLSPTFSLGEYSRWAAVRLRDRPPAGKPEETLLMGLPPFFPLPTLQLCFNHLFTALSSGAHCSSVFSFSFFSVLPVSSLPICRG